MIHRSHNEGSSDEERVSKEKKKFGLTTTATMLALLPPVLKAIDVLVEPKGGWDQYIPKEEKKHHHSHDHSASGHHEHFLHHLGHGSPLRHGGNGHSGRQSPLIPETSYHDHYYHDDDQVRGRALPRQLSKDVVSSSRSGSTHEQRRQRRNRERQGYEGPPPYVSHYE